VPAFTRQLSVLSRCFARIRPVKHDVKALGIAACRKLPEYASPDAECALDDEVLEIMRHEGIVSGRRVHFDDPPTCTSGPHGIVALADAKKRDGHRFATGCCHGGTVASVVS
jgi:hypothetical protein